MTYTYKKMWLDKQNNVIDTNTIERSDGAFIPFDEANSDYQAYLEWAKTNTAEAAD